MIFNLFIREKQFSLTSLMIMLLIINQIPLRMIKLGNFIYRDIHSIIFKTLIIKRVKLNHHARVRVKDSNKDRMKFKTLSQSSKLI